jgi:hypothetical protein
MCVIMVGKLRSVFVQDMLLTRLFYLDAWVDVFLSAGRRSADC